MGVALEETDMNTIEPLPPTAPLLRIGDKVTWTQRNGRALTGYVDDFHTGSPGGWAPWDRYATIRTQLKTVPIKRVAVRLLRHA